jgi:6-phosphofructokinase 1
MSIAVLTSGGDSQGMNAALRAIVRTCIKNGLKCFGIQNGFSGMVHNQINEMKWDDVSGIIQLGGTVIRTARCMEYQNDESARKTAAKNLIKLGINRLVCIGGDGSLTGASKLSQEWPSHVSSLLKEGEITDFEAKTLGSLKIVGLVGSIDNDFYGSSMMIGCDTALHRILYAIDSIRTTAFSHHRGFVVEVMGRDSGYLALISSVISSADWVFLPENPPTTGWETTMCEKIKENNRTLVDKKHVIIIVSEGARDDSGNPIKSDYVKEVMEKNLNIETRVTVLGHVQRGGSPSSYDRYIATLTGNKAVKTLMLDNEGPVVIGMDGMKVNCTPLLEAVQKTRSIPSFLKKGDFKSVLEYRGGEFQDMLKALFYIQEPVPKNTTGVKVGVINIGASAPGMNGCVKILIQAGLHNGLRMFGIKQGLKGLVRGSVSEMSWEEVVDWETAGGSFLGTNRSRFKDFNQEELFKAILQFDVLVCIGGFDCFGDLSQIHTILKDKVTILCIPATISNNLPGTEVSIGFDTSLNHVTSACDVMSQNIVSEGQRLYLVECPGGTCGILTTVGAICSGASSLYLNELPLNLKRITDDVERLNHHFVKEQQIMLTLVNEKASDLYTTEFLTKILEHETHTELTVRETKLGHIVCGGNPTPIDRINATRFGLFAVNYILTGKRDSIMLGINEAKMITTPLGDFTSLCDLVQRRPKEVQWWEDLIQIVNDLSTLYK